MLGNSEFWPKTISWSEKHAEGNEEKKVHSQILNEVYFLSVREWTNEWMLAMKQYNNINNVIYVYVYI